MNYQAFPFPVAGTNIFPISNSKLGGQLVTEYNLKSIDTVGTPSRIDYIVGPSYVHAKKDFEVRIQQDDTGEVIDACTLEIMPGRAVVNGHYIETLNPMLINMKEVNTKQNQTQSAPLKGKLAVGIRIFYSTEPTMAGAMKTENGSNVYEGVQLVVMTESDLKTPFDIDDEGKCPEQSEITAHLRLATFTYYDGAIQIESIVNNPLKCQYIDGERIGNVHTLLGQAYVGKRNLDASRLYVYTSALNEDDPNGPKEDNWCDATNSLMIWDKLLRTDASNVDEGKNMVAHFAQDSVNDQVKLIIPHKQPDGFVDKDGNNLYYPNVKLPIPAADYLSNSPGIITSKYTKTIKAISDRLTQFYQIAKGKQVGYLDSKDEDTKLPAINPSWNIGDYVLVGHDYTADLELDNASEPSTLYVVLPGFVKSVKYAGGTKVTVKQNTTDITILGTSGIKTISNSDPDYNNFVASEEIYPTCTGACLGELVWQQSSGDVAPDPGTGKVAGATDYPQFFTEDDEIRGSKYASQLDYFVLTYYYENPSDTNDSTSQVPTYVKYYYTVEDARSKDWSNYILLTGETPYAQEDIVGGFLNVDPDDSLDAGYVYRDDEGRLRLVDYALLRSGTLAYQLGEDLTLSTGTLADIQAQLNEYVNERIAFPNATQQRQSSTPNVINIYVELPDEPDDDGLSEITIRGIDSRFGASVYLHITGNATYKTTVNIVDCEKIRISGNLVQGGPKINVFRSCLYYDAYVIDYIRQSHDNAGSVDTFKGFQDLTLWYEQFESDDYNLVVDGMTVFELDAPIVSNQIDFWTSAKDNDNHYLYALKSITFSGYGEIVGCQLMMANKTTAKYEGNKIIYDEFTLPNGYGLIYPKSALVKPLSITGTFVNGYRGDDTNVWAVMTSNFTAVTGKYDAYGDDDLSGTIAIHAVSTFVQSEETNIPCWGSDNYHIFSGGVVS